ncbi:MAG: 30S ribosomal protein S20 [Bdellovibrionaceae bacterium]|nr:30S ribosomal protein S20 [Pseudobdellovibrionaceae bacterium]
MANIKSAEKKARQAVVRRSRNVTTMSAVRTAEKKVKTAAAAGDKDKANEALKGYASLASKAAKKNVLKRATVSRKVSRLSLMINKVGTTPTKA